MFFHIFLPKFYIYGDLKSLPQLGQNFALNGIIRLQFGHLGGIISQRNIDKITFPVFIYSTLYFFLHQNYNNIPYCFINSNRKSIVVDVKIRELSLFENT